MYEEPPYQEGGNSQEKVVMMIMLIEGHIEIKDPLTEGDIQIKVEGHLIEEDILIGPPRRGYPNRNGRPQKRRIPRRRTP